MNLYSYVGGNPLTGSDPKGLANSAATFWMRGINPPNYPSNDSSDKCEEKCKHTITVSTGGSCNPGDTMCVISMRQAGFPPPYVHTYKTYDWHCLLKLGIGGKVGGAVAGNAAANQLPKIAEAAGASARALGLIERGVAIFTSPAATAGGLAFGVAVVAHECECPAGQK